MVHSARELRYRERRVRSAFRFVALMGALPLVLGGCTIDLGPDTGPPMQCNAAPDYFLSDVWPRYFERYGCAMSQCHDASTGKGYFRLQNVSNIPAPAATAPVSTWPMEWQNNFKAVERNISCANPLASNVLIVPSGRGQKHPPGVTVTDIPDADAIFSMWLTK